VFAFELIETVTVMLAPPAIVVNPGVTVVQGCVP
jgi:hypothetical protein